MDKMRHKIDPDNVVFSMFTEDDVKKICTVKIVSPLTFDVMGHALNGGLYDRAMGPMSEKGLPCGTCNKNIINCPGHFGYIELPLPVINPLFHKILQTILRLTCLNCYRLQIPSYLKRLISVYMNLLDCGMITEAKEMESVMYEIISSNKDVKVLPEAQNKRIRKLERMSKSIGVEKFILNKTTESLRNKLIHDLLKVLLIKKCMHCKSPIDKIQTFRNRIITNIKKKIESAQDESVSIMTSKASDVRIVNAEESRKHLRKLYENDHELLIELIPVLKRINPTKYPTDIFYFERIPVPPPICRPINHVNDQIVEHPQTQVYKSILQDTIVLRTIIHVVQGKNIVQLNEESQSVYEFAEGKTAIDKLHQMWQQLQTNVDCIMDKDLSLTRTDCQGLKQIIEKKDGVIRMHMMGKRVNFAARSVITPDPNLNIDEIGVPEEFAKHLTYPVPVTSWNVEELRKMVLNGPDVHPGAKMVEFADGYIHKISNQQVQKESILKRLLTPVDSGKEGHRGVTTVYRHLINGDILLLNRQPTLHRPSIMAHTARILQDEKTIRLHYANCKAYNADFDGDEMNLHFPQSELARSEGYNLVNVSNQYLVPKDGTPLSGLIQDHMVSGVRLSMRGKFFKRHDYHQLVYQALGHKTGEIILLRPAMIKPEVLWSGKQILSTVIINTIPKNREPLNLTATAKISVKAWVNHSPRSWRAGGTNFKNGNDMSEAEVVIRGGELLTGVLDKQHYGATPYGLIHCMYELYGGQYATRLLSSFAKLFTCFLQQEGFTLGVHDILVKEKADKKRTKIIEESRKIGHTAAAQAVDLPPSVSPALLQQKLSVASAKNPKFRTIIDRQYKQALDSYTNNINKVCLPAGLICSFPHNNLQLMVQSGAKGSTVNTMQISCLLGQIELEGKRPPVMISGKSLPSFIPFDTQPRAGGFIDGRFMTGILPQEFFFHCMAGREGLIDTAVKTSRSGYLQRCLVKHLEGLKVEYDLTVRDSDQSVIQFFYGEDGMDISKVQFLNKKQLQFLAENTKAILSDDTLSQLKKDPNFRKLKRVMPVNEERKRSSAFLEFSAAVRHKIEGDTESKKEQIIEMWRNATPELKDSFRIKRQPNPLNADYQPDHYFGSLNDKIQEMFRHYKHVPGFADSLRLKAMQSLAVPGEPVGLLAAQSIGEPSTQMTLNTFHFAGRGEMNVTLGIPRLREILMMASVRIKTPSMEIPFKEVTVEQAETLRRSLTRVTVANVLEKVDVHTVLRIHPMRHYLHKLRFHFLPLHLYENDFNVTPKEVVKHMKKFFGLFFGNLKKTSKLSIETNFDFNEREAGAKDETRNNKQNSDSEDDEPEGMDEDAKLASKFKSKDDESDESDNNSNTSDDDDEGDDEGGLEKTLNSEKTSEGEQYTYDKKSYSWCEVSFQLPLSLSNVDLTAILRESAEKSVISEVENIKRAITYKKDEKMFLRTDGININEMSKYYSLLDLNKLYSNDIHRIAHTYGIEAARRVIVKEVKDVFNVYGITVDPRHLLLIADYMTYNGSFEPLSRKGMECNSSPLQQMSFESSLKFLKDASIGGKADSLSSPSSCLMLGKLCPVGTGCFSLLQDISSIL